MFFKLLEIYQFTSVRSVGDGRTTVNGDKMKIEDNYHVSTYDGSCQMLCSNLIIEVAG